MTVDSVQETLPRGKPRRPELNPLLTIRAVQVVLWLLVISGPVAALLVANRVSSIGNRLDAFGALTAVVLTIDTSWVEGFAEMLI